MHASVRSHIALALLVIALNPASLRAQRPGGSFTIEQVKSYPFPNELTAASSGSRIAWALLILASAARSTTAEINAADTIEWITADADAAYVGKVSQIGKSGEDYDVTLAVTVRAIVSVW